MREGGLPRLVDAAQSMDTELRLNGIWAAQNFAHRADLASKQALLSVLPWDSFSSLLVDSHTDIRVCIPARASANTSPWLIQLSSNSA